MKEPNTTDDEDGKKSDAEISDDEDMEKDVGANDDKDEGANDDKDKTTNAIAYEEALETFYEEERLDSENETDNILNKTVESEKSDVDLEPTFILDVSSYSNDDPTNDSSAERYGEEASADPLALACKECGMNFHSNILLTKHKIKEHKDNVEKCRFCRRLFSNKSELLEHQKKHRSHKKHMYKCSVCERHFFTERLLTLHEREHVGTGALFSKMPNAGPRTKHSFKVRCNVCSNDFSSKLTFRRHTEEDGCHAIIDEMKYICTICHNVVTMHEKNNHYCNPRFKCNNCERDFTTKNRLVKHIEKLHCKSGKNLHGSPTENYCLECEIQFGSVEKYDEHNSKTGHNILKLLSCKMCKKMFTREQELIRHTKRHEVYLSKCKYVCRYCQAKFAQPQKLLSHYGGAHPKEKPYKCAQCELDFQNRNKFAIHIRLEHKSMGKMNFMNDFSISFVPNAPASSDPDNAECGEPLEIGAIETVETSDTVVTPTKADVVQTKTQVPSLSYLREFEAMKIISKINEKSNPKIKRRLTSSAKELKLNLVKKSEISQKVIIKKISEDEAREKKRMIINAVPFTKADACAKPAWNKSPEPIRQPARERTNSLDEFLSFSNDNDFPAADDSDHDDSTIPASSQPMLLVNSNPLESLIDKSDITDNTVKEQQPTVTPNNYVNMIINTLMASAAKQQAVMMGPGRKKKDGSKPRYNPKEFDYEAIIKKSLVVDEQAVKEKEEKLKKKKEERAKKEPKSKYKPKEYDYFNIISKSLKYEEKPKKVRAEKTPTKKSPKKSTAKRNASKSSKRSKRLRTEF